MADVSVRPARPTDARLIADLQIAVWRADYAELLPSEVLAGLSAVEVAEQWAAAAAQPPTRAHSVLVALEGPHLVGFAATAPSTDADLDESSGELLILLVAADHRRSGHGSRLMAAAVSELQSAGRAEAIAWLLEGDVVLREFLEGAGWALDGAQRELDAGDPIKQVRLHTELGDD